MRTVSELYKQMMQGRAVYDRIEVGISSASESIVLRDRDIVKDSLSINWRASNNKEFSLGTCYATSLSFTAMQTIEIASAIAGVTNLVVTPVLYYDLGNNTEQAIPLGVFNCDAPKTFSRTTAFECYDNMLAFDVPVKTRFTGIPYNVLNYICGQCDMMLGNSAQEIAAMCNGTQNIVIDPKEVGNMRDALSYIGIVLGCYCIVASNGKFYMRRYHTQTDISIARSRKTQTVFAGYRTTFAGIKCRFLAEQNYYPYEYTEETKTGLVLDVGDLPIIEDTERNKQAVLQNIYNDVLKDCSYYPCEITMVGDPSIEVGDMVETQDRDGTWKQVLLTSFTFVWRGASTLTSEGGNPKQSRVTTAAKRAAQRANQQALNNAVITATYINVGQIEINSTTSEEVTSLRFITNKDLTAIFGAEIPVYSTGDGYVDITYTDSGIEIESVRARVQAGYNLITLVNHLYFETDRVVLLQLKAKTAAMDTGTAPVVTVDNNSIRSYIFAQGIETEAPWDGIISISDTISYVEARLAMYGLTDGVTVTVLAPMEDALSDIVSSMKSELNVYNISDTVDVTLEYGDQIMRCGQGHRAGAGRMLAPLQV